MCEENTGLKTASSLISFLHYQWSKLISELGCLEKFEGYTTAKEEINVEEILEDGHVPEISVKIGEQRLKVSILSQQIQDNELVHDVFKFKPEKREVRGELYVAKRDEVALNLFVPDVRSKDNFQRIHKSQN